jgi:hypothetical protein
MKAERLLRGWALGLLLCVVSIAVTAEEALAVAGKITNAPPGVSLAGGSLTLELEEPLPDGRTEITVPVNQQGEFETPPQVDERKLRACRYTDADGKKHDLPCGWLFFGSGTAATAASSTQSLRRSNWTVDAIFSLGMTSSIGSKDATTTGGGLAVGQGTSGLNGLGGLTGSLMIRAHLPLNLTRGLGDVWMFARYNQHFDRQGTGGAANLHAPVPGNESSTSLTRRRDFEVGVGKSFQTYCHQSGTGCQLVGIYAGASIQENQIRTTSNEIVRTPNFENTSWKPSVVAGASYQIPLGSLGAGWNPFSVMFGADFRRVPCMSVSGTTILPATYRGETESFWEVTTWGGVGISF